MDANRSRTAHEYEQPHRETVYFRTREEAIETTRAELAHLIEQRRRLEARLLDEPGVEYPRRPLPFRFGLAWRRVLDRAVNQFQRQFVAEGRSTI